MNDIERAIEEYAQAYHYRAIGLHAHGCEDALANLRDILASAPAVPFRPGVTGPMRQAMIREDGSVWERVAKFEWRPYAPAVPVGDGWMPIETAPKDGTSILLGRLRAGSTLKAADGYWADCWAWPYVLSEPTHWCALPPALSVDGEG